jgi:hypothetical protein
MMRVDFDALARDEMIRLHRSTQLASLDAGRWYTGCSDGATRVYVVRARRLRTDSTPLDALGLFVKRAGQITIQLDGTLVARRPSGEHTIDRGSIAVDPHLRWNERWIGPSFRALVVEWDCPAGPPPPALALAPLSARDHARLSNVADAIEQHADRDRSINAVTELDAALRALGLPSNGLRSLATSTESPRDIATADLLSSMRSSLGSQPAWIDGVSATGRSERQLRRDVTALLSRLQMPTTSLRSLRARERLVSAAQLLSVKGVTVAEVARCVGFGSSRALSIALERAALPTATAIMALARDG